MPFQDFRDFLDALRKQGELFDVDRPVALEFEVAKALKKSASVAGPAFVFKNNGTDFPLEQISLGLNRRDSQRPANEGVSCP
jgi:4-hydroxy-3-polyprenylbenzoate decarboxylase/2,5-furandicarboxylate decarboxylase 1